MATFAIVLPTSTVATETASHETPNSLWLRPALIAPWWEIVAVLILAQGHFIYASMGIFLRRLNGGTVDLRLTDFKAVHLVGVESATLALLFVYLHWRGWRPSDLKIKMTRAGFSQGIFLALFNRLTLTVGTVIIYKWRGSSHNTGASFLHNHITHLSWAALIASQVVNAIFEEVTCMGYAFNQFAARRGPFFALMLMLFLRAAYHTWKSPSFLIITLFHFSIFGLWYWRTRNIWPLIIAHLAFDILIISPEVR